MSTPTRRSWLVEDLRHRGAERVAALLAEQRHPVRRGADVVAGVVVGADGEVRQAALGDVRAVRAGDADAEPEVVAVVRAGDLLVLDVGAEVPVEDERRAQRPGVAEADDVDPRVAEAALVEAEREVVDHFRVQHRELAPRRVRGVALPGHLQIVVVTIGGDLAELLVVVGELVRVEIRRRVRQRVVVHDRARHAVDHRRRDGVVREQLAAGAAGSRR